MMRKLLLALVALTVLITAFFYFAVNYQRQLATVKVVDDRGEEVVLLESPERLVVLTPAAGRLLAVLQPAGKVVGASSDLITLYPHAEDLGQPTEVAASRIIALRPDLVVLGAPLATLANQLTKAGVDTFLLSPQSVDQAFTGIEQLGLALERTEEADILRRQLTERLEQLQEKVAGQPNQPKVVFWLDDTFRYPPSGTLIDQLLTTAGGQNLAAQLAQQPSFAPADALLALPDVVIGPQPVIDAIRVDGRWKDVPAVISNRLYAIPEGLTPITWENLNEKLELLYGLFYPPAVQP